MDEIKIRLSDEVQLAKVKGHVDRLIEAHYATDLQKEVNFIWNFAYSCLSRVYVQTIIFKKYFVIVLEVQVCIACDSSAKVKKL